MVERSGGEDAISELEPGQRGNIIDLVLLELYNYGRIVYA